MAKLFFRYGSMNSGKTALLLQTAHNYEQQGMTVAIAKAKIDTKGEDHLVSRIGLKRKIDICINKNDDIFKEVATKFNKINCLLIDEAQFLQPKQVDQLMQIVITFNIPVICYGLRTDFQHKGFKGSTRLLEIAHKIEEMKTICKCGRKAICNVRKIDDKITFNGEQIVIDGEKKATYEAMCAHCYYKEKEKQKNKVL